MEKSISNYFSFPNKTQSKCITYGLLHYPHCESYKKHNGFFALMTNEPIHAHAIEALKIYRNKDVIEKAFGNLKERLNMRSMLVSNKQSLEGKLFVEFVALIYLSHIKKTMPKMLDKLDLIESFEAPGQKPFIGEMLEKQKEIF